MASPRPPFVASLGTQSPFHDITTGNNIVPCASGTPNCDSGTFGFTAGPGYDQVTGLGSLDAGFFSSSLRIASTVTLQLSTNLLQAGGKLVLTATVQPSDPNSATGHRPSGFVTFVVDAIQVISQPRSLSTHPGSPRARSPRIPPIGLPLPAVFDCRLLYNGDSRFNLSRVAPCHPAGSTAATLHAGILLAARPGNRPARQTHPQ